MKILVLSDSHSSLRFMRQAIACVQPNAIIHLGDHYDDGVAMHDAFSDIPIYLLPGNCDRYRCPPDQPEILIQEVCGVRLYMTHGHRHNVKQTLSFLLRDARAAGAGAVLYGHTHEAACTQEEDGLWILNPGSSGFYGGSAGLIETAGGRILSCRILREEDIS